MRNRDAASSIRSTHGALHSPSWCLRHGRERWFITESGQSRRGTTRCRSESVWRTALAVANAPVRSLHAFYHRLWSATRPGDNITLELRRDDVPITVEVKAIDRHQYLRLRPNSQ